MERKKTGMTLMCISSDYTGGKKIYIPVYMEESIEIITVPYDIEKA